MSDADAKRFKANADDCWQWSAEATREDDQQAWLRFAEKWDKLAEQARDRRGIFDRYE